MVFFLLTSFQVRIVKLSCTYREIVVPLVLLEDQELLGRKAHLVPLEMRVMLEIRDLQDRLVLLDQVVDPEAEVEG